jgi:dCTP deaminase
MILSDRELRAALECGSLVIDPPPADDAIQPASIELRLDLSGGALRPVRGVVTTIRPGVKVAAATAHDPCLGGVLRLAPGDCALVTTRERVAIPAGLVAQVAGKSSLARLFMIVHTTAGWIDPGFDGTITLEFVNHGPQLLEITDGAKVAQLVVMRLTSAALRPYGSDGLGSRYQHQVGATASRYGDEM